MNVKEENIEKEKDLEKVFEVLKKGMDTLKEKEKQIRFQFEKENDEEKGYFSIQSGNSFRLKAKIETNNIQELFDKTFKYLAVEENINFKEIDEDFSLYDEYKNQFDFTLEEDEILEVINLDDNIISDKIKNIKIDTNNSKSKDGIEKIEVNLSSYYLEPDMKITIKSNDNTLVKNDKDLKISDVATILTDKDKSKEFFENYISETKENQLKVEYVLEEITNSLREIANKENLFYDLKITKEDYQKLEYNLTVKNSEDKIEKEIKSDNLSNFAKEVFSFIENKEEKISPDFYKNFGETKYTITNLDDLKDTKNNQKFSIKMSNENKNKVDLTEIRVPLSEEKEYIYIDNTSIAYTYVDMKEEIKNMLIKNDFIENEKYDNEHIFYRTENIENNLEKLKEKGIDNLKFSSWKEFEDNVVAKGFEKSLFIKSFNITNEKIKDEILETITKTFEERTIEERIELLEKNAEELGLTSNENGKIKEFSTNEYGDIGRNEYEDFGGTIEDVYKENVMNFYYQKHFDVIEKTMEEINKIFSKGELMNNKEVYNAFSNLKNEKQSKNTGIIDKEEEFLGMTFVLNVKEQEKYFFNYDIDESRNEKYFKENFDLEKFNSKLEEVGFHKISKEKAMKIANNTHLEKYDIILEKDNSEDYNFSRRKDKEKSKDELEKNNNIEKGL
jgi:hypothetical protein